MPITLITKLSMLKVMSVVVIKSTVELKRCLILDVRKSSLEVDRCVLGNHDEFPFSLPSCLYRAIFPPLLSCLLREFSCARKPYLYTIASEDYYENAE